MGTTHNGSAIELLPAAGPAPLIVALHGLGTNEHDLIPAYAPLRPHASLAFPRGPLAMPPGFAWYQLVRVGVPEPESFAQALSTLSGVIDELRQHVATDAQPLILSGFSQGASLSLAYALQHPEHIAGVIAFSGYIPKQALQAAANKVTRPPAVFLAHGQADAVIPFARLAETEAALAALGFEREAVSHEQGHTIPAEAMTSAKAWLLQRFPAPPSA